LVGISEDFSGDVGVSFRYLGGPLVSISWCLFLPVRVVVGFSFLPGGTWPHTQVRGWIGPIVEDSPLLSSHSEDAAHRHSLECD